MSREHTLVFYDGHCGLCHRAVRFGLDHDPDGSRFRFAPLQGTTLRETLTPEVIERLPDSIVVVTTDGELLERSNAILEMSTQIGGGWAALARLSRIVPRPLRDLVYRFIARIRHRIFKRPPDLCPLVPSELRERFLP